MDGLFHIRMKELLLKKQAKEGILEDQEAEDKDQEVVLVEVVMYAIIVIKKAIMLEIVDLEIKVRKFRELAKVEDVLSATKKDIKRLIALKEEVALQREMIMIEEAQGLHFQDLIWINSKLNFMNLKFIIISSKKK